MKKLGFLMGAALLTLGSCTNEINEEGFVDKANTISFSAYPNKTRVVTGDVTSDNMKGDNFGVVGYNSNSIYLGSSNAAIQQTWKADENVAGGGSWEYNTQSDLKFCPSSRQRSSCCHSDYAYKSSESLYSCPCCVLCSKRGGYCRHVERSLWSYEP